MTQLIPVVNAGALYCNNLIVTGGTANDFFVSAGACRDSNNVMDLIVNTTSTHVTPIVNGLNGLDQGVLAASTWYYLYVIGCSTNEYPTGFLLSANQTRPYLPFGYDSFRLLSYQRTSGSAGWLYAYESGTGSTRQKWWDQAIQVINAGNSTVLLSVNLLAAVPPVNNLPVYLTVDFTAFAPTTDKVHFANYASTSSFLPGVSALWSTLEVISGLNTSLNPPAPIIQYAVSNASDSVGAFVYGFEYYI